MSTRCRPISQGSTKPHPRHKMDPYKGANSSLKRSILCQLVAGQSARDQPSHTHVHKMDPYYILCELIAGQSDRDRPSHTHEHNMDPYKGISSSLTRDPSYVKSLKANQTGTNQATPTYIRWTLYKVLALL